MLPLFERRSSAAQCPVADAHRVRGALIGDTDLPSLYRNAAFTDPRERIGGAFLDTVWTVRTSEKSA